MTINIEFNHLNNCIHCYPHIINICRSHIIASSTHISKQFLKTLKFESDGDLVYSNHKGNDNNNDNNDNNDDNNDKDNGNDNNNDGHLFAQETDIPKLVLNEKQVDDILDDELRAWYLGLKQDPIKRTRRIVRIMCSSDQRRQAFKNVINTGNHSGWFRSHDNEVIKLPNLELLRDVKTWWDSVYCIIKRLLVLWPVSVHIYRHPFHSYC